MHALSGIRIHDLNVRVGEGVQALDSATTVIDSPFYVGEPKI
jgi:hypothetical protein